jgi:hypothetical protein
MSEIKTEQSRIREEYLYSVRMEEPAVMAMYSKIPEDYFVDMLAREFLPVVKENMEITEEMNLDYGKVRTARIVIVPPSEVFKYWKMKPYEEIVVLDYRGFSKRMVTRQDCHHLEFALEPDLLELNEFKETNNSLKFEIARFVWSGQRNVVGERIFRYEPEIRKKRRKNE